MGYKECQVTRQRTYIQWTVCWFRPIPDVQQTWNAACFAAYCPLPKHGRYWGKFEHGAEDRGISNDNSLVFRYQTLASLFWGILKGSLQVENSLFWTHPRFDRSSCNIVDACDTVSGRQLPLWLVLLKDIVAVDSSEGSAFTYNLRMVHCELVGYSLCLPSSPWEKAIALVNVGNVLYTMCQGLPPCCSRVERDYVTHHITVTRGIIHCTTMSNYITYRRAINQVQTKIKEWASLLKCWWKFISSLFHFQRQWSRRSTYNLS